VGLAVARIAGQVVPGVKVARAWSAESAWNGGGLARILPPRQGRREGCPRVEEARGAKPLPWLAVGPARSSGDPPAWRGGAGSEGAGLLVALFVLSTSGGWEERHGGAEAGRRAQDGIRGAAGRGAVRGDRVRGLACLAEGGGGQGGAGGGRAVHRG